MSFLKIKDPVKRDQIVKEYLATKKRIRDSQLAEKTGEIELQTGLSKFFKPITETQKEAATKITETQKDTTKKITKRLKPIKEGIEKLPKEFPQQIGYPLSTAPPSYRSASPSLTIPESLGEEASFIPSTEEKTEEQEKIDIEILANPDNVFGIRKTTKGMYMGFKPVEISKGKIIIDDGKHSFHLTKGLKNLIFYRGHNPYSYTANDFSSYGKILKLTGAMHNNNDPNNPFFKRQRKGDIDESLMEKANIIREDIWEPYKLTLGKGITIIPSNPNSLLERLDLLMASKEAGNTGVRNELVSICDELKRQRVLNSKSYKKLMSIL